MGERCRPPVIVTGLLVVALLAGCGSDPKPKSGITIDTLAAASGTACPVPLEVAADNSGIDTPSPATGSVAVGEPSPATDPSSPAMSPLDEADGVEVSCALPLADGGAVDLLLIAARTDQAPLLVVAAAADAAKLSRDQATQLANDTTRTAAGQLVPVPGSNAVAVMPTTVNGATSAAMVVSSKGLKRPQIEQIARQLDQRLH